MDFTALEGFQYPLQCFVGIRKAPWSTFKKVLHPVFLDGVPFVAGDGLCCRDQKGIIRKGNNDMTGWIF